MPEPERPHDALEVIAPLVDMILGCIHREYPNQIVHGLSSDDDLAPPRELHPAFFGSFDWHSSVHGHWSLARASRLLPEDELRDRCLAALARSLTPENIEGELAYFDRRSGFECPYGISWLLLLHDELERASLVAESRALAPLAAVCERSLLSYLEGLTHPVRSGQHDQSAFSLGLFLDVARRRERESCERKIIDVVLRHYSGDVDAPIRYEPSNHDFLSPALSEADLMQRVLPEEDFAAWLSVFLPGIPVDGGVDWLSPIGCPDPSDGRLSHRIGLDLSRSFMLKRIGEALGEADPRRRSLLGAAAVHREAGLSAIDPRHYSGAHWLGTFGIYLLSAGAEPGEFA